MTIIKKHKPLIFAGLFAALLAICTLFYLFRYPPGAIVAKDIVSYCVGDATGDGNDVMLLIAGRGTLDTGEFHGSKLLLCNIQAQDNLDTLGYIPKEQIQMAFDLAEIKPMKVLLGDVDGDGIQEIGLCVYKTAKFHPVLAKRPFFFRLTQGNLIPVWLGSRLSRPFDDYTLADTDGDSISEILSIEPLQNGEWVVAIYDWAGFGFELTTQSQSFPGTLVFDAIPLHQPVSIDDIRIIHTQGETTTSYTLYQEDGQTILR